MTKFKQKLSSFGVLLMLVFPICVIVGVLCSDYRTEEEYYQSIRIGEFLVNWYTFGSFLVGVLCVLIGEDKFSLKR